MGDDERMEDKPCVSDMSHNSEDSGHQKRGPMGGKQKRLVVGDGRPYDVGECRSYRGKAR